MRERSTAFCGQSTCFDDARNREETTGRARPSGLCDPRRQSRKVLVNPDEHAAISLAETPPYAWMWTIPEISTRVCLHCSAHGGINAPHCQQRRVIPRFARKTKRCKARRGHEALPRSRNIIISHKQISPHGDTEQLDVANRSGSCPSLVVNRCRQLEEPPAQYDDQVYPPGPRVQARSGGRHSVPTHPFHPRVPLVTRSNSALFHPGIQSNMPRTGASM